MVGKKMLIQFVFTIIQRGYSEKLATRENEIKYNTKNKINCFFTSFWNSSFFPTRLNSFTPFP